MPYEVLGADFLAFRKLIVDISAPILIKLIEVEQYSRYMDSELNDTFNVQSGNELDNMIQIELKNEYPEVCDEALLKQCYTHSVVVSTETILEEPISCETRRLNLKKFRVFRKELKRLCDKETLEKSQSA